MSHFSVMVVIEDAFDIKPETIADEVDRRLAPFMENCCGEPDKMYMKFFDEEDDYLKQYNEESREMVVMPDGRLLLPWDEEFKTKKPKEGQDVLDWIGKVEPPAELPKRQVPFKESFSTFEEFVKEWHGRKERDETYNRYGYWQNPNAKWDWYEIGGRWAGFFQLKKGHSGAIGKQYNFSGKYDLSTDRADIVFKLAIDFEAMRKEKEEAAALRYDMVQEAIKGLPKSETWEEIKSEFDLNKKDEIDKARKKYHDQPMVKAFSDLCRSEKGRDLFGFFADVEAYHISREQYLQNARNHAAVPFAVVKDGKWVEQGNMGWWGMASNEKDPETWNSMVAKLYDELPDETLLVNVDCHI